MKKEIIDMVNKCSEIIASYTSKETPKGAADYGRKIFDNFIADKDKQYAVWQFIPDYFAITLFHNIRMKETPIWNLLLDKKIVPKWDDVRNTILTNSKGQELIDYCRIKDFHLLVMGLAACYFTGNGQLKKIKGIEGWMLQEYNEEEDIVQELKF